ncbi:SMP-30/gluconolactonase/LRE family protein [Bryobacter aggregatus]|uniref:SMP-30/gluconolactonase/LRE family protein n=1 Tax=Bryobacter aggregatus TaxID=360054 RepID=UPI0006916C91|nr:SMP-30/gluconolactonase/LRE family protein [Bryobacter aggregatus]
MRFGLLWIACVLCAQDYSEVQVEKATGGLRFAEGPLWSKENNALLFCDAATGTIHALLPGNGLAKFREEMGGPTALAFDLNGKLLIAQSKLRRIVRTSLSSNPKIEVLAERFEGKRLNGPNDLAVRKDGHIYFTDPAYGSQIDARELDFDGIYHLSPTGALSLIAKPKGRPNGITLSPNGKILYVANSDERKIYAYDLDGRGNAANERVILEKLDGVPGGLRTDEKGNLYIAANHVLIYSPNGKLLHTLHVSDKPSNLAFGEADLMTLFITAKTSVYRVKLKVKGAVAE